MTQYARKKWACSKKSAMQQSLLYFMYYCKCVCCAVLCCSPHCKNALPAETDLDRLSICASCFHPPVKNNKNNPPSSPPAVQSPLSSSLCCNARSFKPTLFSPKIRPGSPRPPPNTSGKSGCLIGLPTDPQQHQSELDNKDLREQGPGLNTNARPGQT